VNRYRHLQAVAEREGGELAGIGPGHTVDPARLITFPIEPAPLIMATGYGMLWAGRSLVACVLTRIWQGRNPPLVSAQALDRLSGSL
jgi:hypothetical protein